MMMPMMSARPMDLVERLQLITAETARIKASKATRVVRSGGY